MTQPSMLFTLTVGLCACLLTRPVEAHFIWLTLAPEGNPTEARIHFSESAAPDNPELLSRIAGAQLWMVQGRRQDPVELQLTSSEKFLLAELPSTSSVGPVLLSHTYGVLAKGDAEPFLLKYHAKAYPSTLPGDWRAVKDAERLALEIVPRVMGQKTAVQVLWKNEPLSGATLAITGPELDEKLEGVTNQSGELEVTLPAAGVYSILAKHEESTPGELDGKPYSTIRHYSTLALPHLPARVESVAHTFPPLPQGITSFGAAIADDAAYVYGGNVGQTHQYHRGSQTGSFLRLDLQQPTQWQELAEGPRLQGLAMVEHKGSLYRIGGFQARNAEGEEQSLWSQADCARYVPGEDHWEALPDLPAGRSSHDAAVIGDVIYVVGGWELQGDGESATWHDTVLKLDLSAQPLAWQTATKLPHSRRGLAVAAHGGKLVVIGGMEEWGTTTRSVAIFDPATEAWSEGPEILGSSMDGFGASAFACDSSLYVSSSSGVLQKLSPDGNHWEYVGMLSHPRMFHRIAPWHDKGLVVMGGVQMGTGKVLDLEMIPVK